MRILTAVLLVGAITGAAACGGSKSPAPAPTPIRAAPPAKPAGSKFTVDYMSPGFAPVQVEVLRAGTGKVASIGADVVMNYVAKAQGHEPYASSRQAGSQPMETTVGVGKPGLIPGWDAAAIHMRAGDLWKLTIPAELGYGKNGGPKVPPNSIIEIEVEMLTVR